MLGNLGELAKIMSRARDIQSAAKKMKEEMPTLEFSASVPFGNGVVKATVSGDFMVKSVEIPDCGASDELNAVVRQTINLALGEAKDTMRERVRSVTGDLGIELPMP
jgi:DNA-binding protein YbaB